MSLIATLKLTEVNDMFANRATITGSSNTVMGSNVFAAKEPANLKSRATAA